MRRIRSSRPPLLDLRLHRHRQQHHRLLVADAGDGELRELVTQRAFTRIGKSLGDRGSIPAEKIAETAAVVQTQVAVAKEVGAEHILAVATAAIRTARNRDELVEAVAEAGGVELTVLTSEEEARLSFVGATRTLLRPVEGTVAVIDVGGGSTEIAIGEADGRMEWSESFRIGSGFLADAYLHSDPPAVDELEKIRRHVGGTFGDSNRRPRRAPWPSAARRPRYDGSSAPSSPTRRSSAGSECFAHADSRGGRRFELDTERVRLLPAGILVLEAISDLLGLPLRIARGGLREGMLLELVEGRQLA